MTYHLHMHHRGKDQLFHGEGELSYKNIVPINHVKDNYCPVIRPPCSYMFVVQYWEY